MIGGLVKVWCIRAALSNVGERQSHAVKDTSLVVPRMDDGVLISHSTGEKKGRGQSAWCTAVFDPPQQRCETPRAYWKPKIDMLCDRWRDERTLANLGMVASACTSHPFRNFFFSFPAAAEGPLQDLLRSPTLKMTCRS
jgi:hypothetical protein